MNTTKTYTSQEIYEIVRMHGLWLRGEDGGFRAKLASADLAETDLTRVNLARAVMAGVDLTRTFLAGVGEHAQTR